jgi:hypothetical protein
MEQSSGPQKNRTATIEDGISAANAIVELFAGFAAGEGSIRGAEENTPGTIVLPPCSTVCVHHTLPEVSADQPN